MYQPEAPAREYAASQATRPGGLAEFRRVGNSPSLALQAGWVGPPGVCWNGSAGGAGAAGDGEGIASPHSGQTPVVLSVSLKPHSTNERYEESGHQ